MQAQVKKPQALIIGVVQGLCLPFRGFSRSGATISTALLCGLSQPVAEEFSFALAVLVTPPVIVQDLRLAFTYVGEIRDKLRNIGDLRPLSVSPVYWNSSG